MQETNITTMRTIEQVEADIAAQLQAGVKLREMYMNAYSAAATPLVIGIGNCLKEEKALCKQLGLSFADRIREKFGFSHRTANNYMSIAEQIPVQSPLTNLPYTKVLALLAVPADEREQFAADVGAQDMSKAELQKAVKERAEAIKRAEEAELKAQAAAAAVDRQSSIAEQYSEKYTELKAQYDEIKDKTPDIVTETVVVPPDDYDTLKAQVDALKARADQAEMYAERQEEARKKAQNEANRLRALSAEAAATTTTDDPLSIASFSAACRDFMAVLGAVPNMAAYFYNLPSDELQAYKPWIDSMAAWVEGARKAISADGLRMLPGDVVVL